MNEALLEYIDHKLNDEELGAYSQSPFKAMSIL